MFNFLLLALISLFAFSFLPAKASEKVDILVLQQDSALLGLGTTVELGPDFIQVNAKASGLTAVARAPLWEVFIVRPSAKIYFPVPYKRACSMVSLLGTGGSMVPSCTFKLPSKHSEFERKGNRFFEYRFPGETLTSSYLSYSMAGRKEVVEYFGLITLQKNLPEQESVILSKLLSLPPAKGIPYSLLRYHKTLPCKGSIATRSMSVVQGRRPDFGFLEKFKRAAKIENVLINDASEQVIEEFLK